MGFAKEGARGREETLALVQENFGKELWRQRESCHLENRRKLERPGKNELGELKGDLEKKISEIQLLAVLNWYFVNEFADSSWHLVRGTRQGCWERSAAKKNREIRKAMLTSMKM